MKSIYNSQAPALGKSDRLLSRRYLPNSAKGGSFSPLFFGYALTASVSAADSSTVIFGYTIFSSEEIKPTHMITLPRRSIFIGSLSDPSANILPGGTSIAHSGFLLWGPINTPYDFDGVAAKPWEHMSRVAVSNRSGLVKTISVIVEFIRIANPGSTGQE